MNEPTDVKCVCGHPMPADPYVTEGYRKGEGNAIVAFICDACWDKGLRWDNYDQVKKDAK